MSSFSHIEKIANSLVSFSTSMYMLCYINIVVVVLCSSIDDVVDVLPNSNYPQIDDAVPLGAIYSPFVFDKSNNNNDDDDNNSSNVTLFNRAPTCCTACGELRSCFDCLLCS
jgi:hypothetical protein